MAEVWIFSAISAIALLLILVVPFIWCCSDWKVPGTVSGGAVLLV